MLNNNSINLPSPKPRQMLKTSKLNSAVGAGVNVSPAGPDDAEAPVDEDSSHIDEIFNSLSDADKLALLDKLQTWQDESSNTEEVLDKGSETLPSKVKVNPEEEMEEE